MGSDTKIARHELFRKKTVEYNFNYLVSRFT